METLTIHKTEKTTGNKIWDLQLGENKQNSGSSQTNTSFGHLDKGPKSIEPPSPWYETYALRLYL